MIIIPGLSSSTKRPGFYGETRYGAGPITAGSIPYNVLYVGNKTSSGTMTADGSPVQVFGQIEAEALAGAGSELAMMAVGADGLGGGFAIPGVNIWLACVAEASGAQATATVTFAGGTATSTGTNYYRVCGVQVPLTISLNMTIAQAATALALAINSKTTLPVTAAAGGSGGAVVTITAKNIGPRGNWFTLFQDTSSGPGTTTSTLAGGTSMTGGGVRFTGGSGSDDHSNIISAVSSTQYDIIAIACGDATTDAVNLARWKTAVSNAAGASIGILEHYVVASTDTLTNASGLSKTTLNDARAFVAHSLNNETPATVIAGVLAAIMASTQEADPGAGQQYAGLVLPGVAPQTQAADKPNAGTVETALGEGVTELETRADGTVRISRLITTKCLNGSTPDYRTLDSADSFVPDYCRLSAKLLWETDIQPNAPRVAPSVPLELRQPPSGVLTPQAWADALTALAKQFERGEGLAYPILTDVDNNLPTAQWDNAGHFITSAWPVRPMYGNFIVGLSVRQQ